MRHRRKGRVLGRSPSHRKALFRNLASALFLTERAKDDYLDEKQAPKVTGRIITTLPKAKEVRPLVERCVRIACAAQQALDDARPLGTTAERNSDAWRTWRKSDRWRKWAAAMSPVVLARRPPRGEDLPPAPADAEVAEGSTSSGGAALGSER